ncbi:MAG: hypothetical protein IIA72_02300 [Proteobacteria bacterium]|nr:hypothetical protein [Pseudomonadota bacterium]
MSLNELMTEADTKPTVHDRVDDIWTTEFYQKTAIIREIVRHPTYRFKFQLGTEVCSFSPTDPNVGSWLEQAVQELNRVAGLQADWDSYGASPVSQLTLEDAFVVLAELMKGHSTLPQIGASVAGGVELEWHQPGVGLEIEVRTPTMIHAYFYDDDQPDEEWEGDLKLDNIFMLEPYVGRFAS